MTKKKPYSNIDIVIPGNVAWCDDEDMIWDVKLFYGVIRGLTRNDFYCCFASNEHLAEQLGKTPRTIRRFLEILENKGFIYRTNTYIIDKFDKITYTRAIVPTDLKKQFEKQSDKMKDLKEVSKKCSKGGKEFPPTGGQEFPPNILKEYPCEKNIPITNTEIGINPLAPLPQGGTQKDALIEPEQFELVGKYANVRITKSQKAAFSGEFGEAMALALIEQLSAYIQSGVKRYRKKVDHYAILRDWALRRTQPKYQASTKILIGGRDLERRAYSKEELNSLFTKLDDEDDST